MITWTHEADQKWMDERKNYITATDIRKVWSAYKKIANEEVENLPNEKLVQFMKLVCEKYVPTTNLSTGAAARGHVREPYTIAAYNQWKDRSYKQPIYHWDNAIIVNGSLAFSPDALNIEQVSGIKFLARDLDIRYVAEVKNYSVSEHLDTYYGDKAKLGERIQLAVALAVLPEVNQASLILDCPFAIGHEIFEVVYTRNDLAEEIGTVREIAKVLSETKKRMREMRKATLIHSVPDHDVYNTFIDKRLKELNLERRSLMQ